MLGVRVDRIFHDQITDTTKRNEVTIVGIDDVSLQNIGAWPWDRDIFAYVLETLMKKGARLVVFDILFLEPRKGDSEMLKTINTYRRPVLFASKLDQGSSLIESIYKTSPYVLHGITQVYPDDDGKVRTIPFFQKDSNGICYESLAYQAFSIYTKEFSQKCDTAPKLFLFQETKPKTISLNDVLHGNVLDETLKDKVIFIGSDSLDIEDHFISQTGEKIPGVYVHASIFTTLLNNSFLKPLQGFVYFIVTTLFLLTAILTIFRLKNLASQIILLTAGAFLLIFFTLLMLSLHYEVSLSKLLFPYSFGCLFAIMFRYATTEKKSLFIKELFGQYVNPKVLANILKDNDLKLGGEKKYITILFSDIRGFTTMTEKMTPEKLVETLNAYLETMSPIIMKNDGVIDKYIGDAIMAFWNAPIDVSNHEEKSVRASLLMVDALEKMQKETPLEIGIGLHAGVAIVGNIGSKTRINYTIIGDAVNACSRLEGLTKKYGLKIIASEQIKNAVTSPDIIWRTIDIVRVKGKTEVMKLYEPMHNTKENKALAKHSDDAFAAYFSGNFMKAKHSYKNIHDAYSIKMIDRIELLKNDKYPSWNGVWDWDEK